MSKMFNWLFWISLCLFVANNVGMEVSEASVLPAIAHNVSPPVSQSEVQLTEPLYHSPQIPHHDENDYLDSNVMLTIVVHGRSEEEHTSTSEKKNLSISKDVLGKSASGSLTMDAHNTADGDKCPICLEIVREPEKEETWVQLRNCNHGFHSECIIRWINERKTCPVCRQITSESVFTSSQRHITSESVSTNSQREFTSESVNTISQSWLSTGVDYVCLSAGYFLVVGTILIITPFILLLCCVEEWSEDLSEF